MTFGRFIYWKNERRASTSWGEGDCPMPDTALSPTRSWLFTPATRPERFAKAAASGADVSILDLEDSVAARDKDGARDTALGFLAARPAARVRHALRINGLDTRAGLRDL